MTKRKKQSARLFKNAQMLGAGGRKAACPEAVFGERICNTLSISARLVPRVLFGDRNNADYSAL